MISVEDDGGKLVYRRECCGENAEKVLLTDCRRILINPIEPVNKPKELTPYLNIDFQNTLMIEPGLTKKVFIKFPVEIGVFTDLNDTNKVIDIFTRVKRKYTVYGADVVSGILCAYWKSGVYPSIPEASPLDEGVLELDMKNTTDEWFEVTKAVFKATRMKIYYCDDIVSMKAYMNILGSATAETDFFDSPIKEGMHKSLELYRSRMIAVVGTRFMMENGI